MNDATEKLTDDAQAAQGERRGDAGATDLTVSPERAAARARWAEIVFIISFSLYAVLAVLAHYYAYFDWDVSINRAIRSITLPGFNPLMIWLSWLGSDLVPLVLVVGTGVALMAGGFRLEGIICMIGVSLGSAMNGLLKLVIARPRPDSSLIEVVKHYNHNSFPSGHVTFFIEYFGFLFFLSYVLLRRGRLRNSSFVVLGLLILLISVSRVYMGAHWPSDTLGAYLAGGVWLMLMIEVYRRLKAKRARPERVAVTAQRAGRIDNNH
jgi:membrane-associated phospholipid phosphatase